MGIGALRGLGAVLLLAMVVGCGPIEYVSQVTVKADRSVAAARAVEADKWAPYYYTLAVEYLHKAREEASYSDFQAANRFGRLAKEAADKAKEAAVRRAADPDAEDMPITGDGDDPMAPVVPAGEVEEEGDGDEPGDLAPLDLGEDGDGDDEAPPDLGGDTP